VGAAIVFLGKIAGPPDPLSEGSGEFGNMFRCKQCPLQADLSTELEKLVFRFPVFRMVYFLKDIAIGGFLLSLEKIRSLQGIFDSEKSLRPLQCFGR
jgi:hypothetical protein